MSYDIVISNGKILDGTGNPWFKAYIGVKDGRISKISRTCLKDAAKTIDAKGFAVSPGFIDIHTHSDRSVLLHNRCENSLHMGVTSMGGGNCGSTVYPITEKNRDNITSGLKGRRWRLPEEMSVEVDWSTLTGWREHVENMGIGANLIPYVGFGTLRRSVMGVEGDGGERYYPTDDEREEMKTLCDQAMSEGCFGLSTGLFYSEQRNASTEEVIEIAKVVAKYGGMYISHLRAEESAFLQACHECIEICKKSGLRGSLTHFKIMFPENWGKIVEGLHIIDRARAMGIEVYCDAYPWLYCDGTHLGGILGSTTSRKELLKELEDSKKWEETKKNIRSSYEKEIDVNNERKEMLSKKKITPSEVLDPETFYYIVSSKTRSDLEGKNFTELAKTMNIDDPLDAARELFIKDEGFTYTAGCCLNEEDYISVLKHPLSMVSTDSSTFDMTKYPFSEMSERLGWAHPRGWGSHPKILQKYVREMKLISIEKTIRKMTGLPAQFLDLKDRGLIKEGYWADITIFDPEKIENKASYAQPMSHPEGIPYVIVNGQIVIDESEHTGTLSGKVLLHNT